MLQKKKSRFKGYSILLVLALLAGSNMSLFAKDTDPLNDPLRDQADPFKLQPLEFRLGLSEPDSQPDIFLFTLAQRQRNGVENAKEIFAILRIKEKDSRIHTNLQRVNRRKRLGKTLYTISLLSLTALNIADYISTVKALQYEGLQEGNPLVQPFTKNIVLFSALKMGIAFYDFYILKKIYRKNKTIGWLLSLAGNFAMSYIVSNNIKKIQSVAIK